MDVSEIRYGTMRWLYYLKPDIDIDDKGSYALMPYRVVADPDIPLTVTPILVGIYDYMYDGYAYYRDDIIRIKDERIAVLTIAEKRAFKLRNLWAQINLPF